MDFSEVEVLGKPVSLKLRFQYYKITHQQIRYNYFIMESLIILQMWGTKLWKKFGKDKRNSTASTISTTSNQSLTNSKDKNLPVEAAWTRERTDTFSSDRRDSVMTLVWS